MNQTVCILWENPTKNRSKLYTIWQNAPSWSTSLQYIGKIRAKSVSSPPKQHNSSKPSVFIRKINEQSTKSVRNISSNCVKWIEVNQIRCIYKETQRGINQVGMKYSDKLCQMHRNVSNWMYFIRKTNEESIKMIYTMIKLIKSINYSPIYR